MKINYLTTNQLKYSIAKNFFNSIDGFELIQHSFEVPEIQAASCEEVARQSAVYAAHELGEPCVVMDAGFFIEALNGFPGPFVKYVNEWLTEEQLLRMLSDSDSRAAHFTDALAIGFPDGTATVFSHKTIGTLANEGQYSPSKWPVNSLFIPKDHVTPLGLMSEEDQSDFWSIENKNWKKLVNSLTSSQAAESNTIL